MTSVPLPLAPTSAHGAGPAGPSRRPRRVHRHAERWDAEVHAAQALTPLEVLVAQVAALLEGCEVGAAAVDANHVLQPVVGSCDRVCDLVAFQSEHVEGPVVEAFLAGEAILDREVSSCATAWPRFAAVAAAMGYRHVHAVPLATGAEVVGAMLIGDTGDHPLSAGSLAAVLALAEVSAVALLQELAHHQWEARSHQLQIALDSRVLVEQAKGALAERLGTTPGDAFELLRSFARSHNRPIDDVARAVLSGPVALAS